MVWTLALAALGTVFVGVTVLSMFGSSWRRRKPAPPLQSFLLAGGTLGRSSVVSLLLSSSFGINAVLYAVWLGYTIGVWGIAIQAAWALSFVLLSPFASAMRKERSLHALLGSRFGFGTRIVAGLCSVLGIMYLMGWEVAVGKSTLAHIFAPGGMLPEQAPLAAAWLSAGIVLASLFYTLLGGLKGNAFADLLLNVVKLVAVVTLLVLLAVRVNGPSWQMIVDHLFPSLDTMKRELGWWGLVTNVAFNLAWQFVDTSTWQSVISAKDDRDTDSVGNLRWSGLTVFFAPGVVATLIGVMLAGATDISQDNVLGHSVALAGSVQGVIGFVAFVAVIACIMSMIDGYILAAGYALVVDVLHPRSSLEKLDEDDRRAERLVAKTRVALIAITVVGAWGVQALLDLLNLSIFDFVYVVIVTQLSLLGPILMAFWDRHPSRLPLWIAILAGLLVGFGLVVVGSLLSAKWLVDGAGTFTVFASCAAAYTISRRSEVAHV